MVELGSLDRNTVCGKIASTWANHTSGSACQNGGILRLTAEISICSAGATVSGVAKPSGFDMIVFPSSRSPI